MVSFRTERLHRLQVAGGSEHEHPPPCGERLAQPREQRLERGVAVHGADWREADEALDVIQNKNAARRRAAETGRQKGKRQ